MHLLIREYAPPDQQAVDALVQQAWSELATHMPGWADLSLRLRALTARAHDSEVLLAECDGLLAGAVGYVGPQQPKPDFFDAGWPIVRLLSVSPLARGQGVGQALLDACVARAERDGCPGIALHTTPVMASAQRLYRRAGFTVARALPDMYGVPYVLMTRQLGA